MLAKELGSAVTFTLQNLLYYNFFFHVKFFNVRLVRIAFNTLKVPKTFHRQIRTFLANKR